VPGIARVAPTAEPTKFIAIPSLVLADGATVGLGNLAYITRINPDVPLQVRVGYGRLVIDDVDDKDRLSVDGKAVFTLNNTVDLSANAEFIRTLKTARSLSLGVVAEKTLPRGFGVSGNLNYVSGKPDGEESVEDIAPGLGISCAWRSSTSTSFDYTFIIDC
jgi:hypothetical protein